MSNQNYNKLLSIYHPFSSNRFYGVISLLFGINLFPAKPIDNKNTYDVYIKDNILYTHTINVIDLFLKNDSIYKIYSKNYSDYKPILEIFIYEDQIVGNLTSLYSFSVKGDYMYKFLNNIEIAYNQYKNSETLHNKII